VRSTSLPVASWLYLHQKGTLTRDATQSTEHRVKCFRITGPAPREMPLFESDAPRLRAYILQRAQGILPRGNGKMTEDPTSTDHLTADCDICTYARLHAGWPPQHRGTHCRDCHRSWTGLARAHCVVCHATFSTNGTADLHWSSSGYDANHLDPASVTNRHGEPLLVLDEKGIWHRAGRKPAYLTGTRSEAAKSPPGTSAPEPLE
jgi:hypothetical protein